MAERRILRLDGGLVSVAKESRFDSEGDQHQAIAQHPEVLPSEDLVAAAGVPRQWAWKEGGLASDALRRLHHVL